MEQPETQSAQDALAVKLLTAVAKAMCGTLYTHQTHSDSMFLDIGITEDDYDAERQAAARRGALFDHFCISSFERFTAALVALGIVERYLGYVHRMTIDADQIATLMANSNIPKQQWLSNAIEAFFSYERQPKWPAAHFPSTLVTDFVRAGLLEGPHGNLHWTPNFEVLNPYRDLGGVWYERQNPNPLFARICGQ